jgi:hypothetical protein
MPLSGFLIRFEVIKAALETTQEAAPEATSPAQASIASI